MAAGDFTATQLLKIKLKAEQMWKNSQLNNSLAANAEAAKAVLENQTARITELQNPDKDREVTINWINPCAMEAADCESNCDIDEAELETDGKDYALDLCKKTGFNVDREKIRTNSYEREEIVAAGMMRALTVLDEWWAGQALTKLKAFAGVNVAPAPWTYNDGTSTTEVPAADWTLDMIANFLYQTQLNKMPGSYYINDGNLWVQWMNAQLQSGNLDGKGDAARIAAIKMYFDSFNFAKAGITENLFAVAPGAVAMVTKARNPDTPTLVGGTIQQNRFTINSQLLPGVKYDVYQSLKCVTVNGKSHDTDQFRIETNGGIFLNPEGCDVTIGEDTFTPTGVISYTKVA